MSQNWVTSQRASQSIAPTRRSTQHGGNQAMEVGLSTTVEDSNALTIKTLKQHLAAHKLPTSSVKRMLVHCLYNAIHGESSRTTQTENPTATISENPICPYQLRYLLQATLLLNPLRQSIKRQASRLIRYRP